MLVLPEFSFSFHYGCGAWYLAALHRFSSERGRYLTGLWKATEERAAPPLCFNHGGQPFGRLLPARKSTGSGRLLLYPKMVSDREYAGHTVGADAGEVLVGLGLNDAFQADVAVLDDDVDWGDGLQSVAT